MGLRDGFTLLGNTGKVSTNRMIPNTGDRFTIATILGICKLVSLQVGMQTLRQQ